MMLTININDSVADKILYFLEHFKEDVTIVNSGVFDESCDVEVVTLSDPDYKVILQAREERKKHPENYLSEDKIDWD